MGYGTSPTRSDPLEEAIQFAHCRFRHENSATRTVMVARRAGFQEGRTRRHLKLRMDAHGNLYVRVGKRGQSPLHLDDMAGARIIDRDHKLAVFFEEA
jgi:hypothetical protein